MICPLSPAHFVALAAYELFALLLFIKVDLAPLPLLFFLLCCCLAPFSPRLGFFLPITFRGRKDSPGVSLTFDDGPDPAVTPQLLELLKDHGIAATFFVTGERAERYPELIRAILAEGHMVGNHSYSHFPFLMLKSAATLRREVASAQQVLRQFGIVPLAFRPPVGVTNARLWRVLLENGMFCVNFSLRAGDMGNRRITGLAGRLLAKVKRGDIILLHEVAPRQGEVADLLAEFSALIEGLKEKGLPVLPLSRLIEKEVMQKVSTVPPHAVRLFYDNLAGSYDQEQASSAFSPARDTERRLFADRFPDLFGGAERVLEVGAGTGIFTLQIARSCQEVVAVDISGNMLAHLQKKAAEQGIANVRVLEGNVESMELPGPFSVVCAFSSLEYLSDLPAFCRRLSALVEPGGAIYFVTARRSFFRFFTQIGNAMRQGLWLKAYSPREMESMLRAAGFQQIDVRSHLLKCLISGGMLLEVAARRVSAAPAG